MKNDPLKSVTGKSAQFLRDHVAHDDDACLPWPFSRDRRVNRGRLGGPKVNGKRTMLWAHRAMCELAHGAPPTPKHHASFSCGGGSNGCVNPCHLSWRTNAGAQRARYRRNGATSNPHGQKGILTVGQIEQIRALRPTHTQTALAGMFGVSLGAIQYQLKYRQTRALARSAGGIYHARPRALTPADTMRAVNAIVPRLPGREDICQEIMLAIWDGKFTLEHLQANSGDVRSFVRTHYRNNFETGGYAISLDVPMKSGQSWHDVLPHIAEEALAEPWLVAA